LQCLWDRTLEKVTIPTFRLSQSPASQISSTLRCVRDKIPRATRHQGPTPSAPARQVVLNRPFSGRTGGNLLALMPLVRRTLVQKERNQIPHAAILSHRIIKYLVGADFIKIPPTVFSNGKVTGCAQVSHDSLHCPFRDAQQLRNIFHGRSGIPRDCNERQRVVCQQSWQNSERARNAGCSRTTWP